MKQTFLLLFVATVVSLSFTCSAQKVYSVNYEYMADVKVYVVEQEYEADLVVYATKQDYKARKSENKGIWFFCSQDYQADKKIYFVDHAYQADLKIYFTKQEYRAGWKKKQKKNLMY